MKVFCWIKNPWFVTDVAFLFELLSNASLTKSLQSPQLSAQAAGHRAGDGDPLVAFVTRLHILLLTSDGVDDSWYVSDFAGDKFERLV